jgi:hypothetical protein
MCYQLLKTRGFLGALLYKTRRPSSDQKYKYMDVQDGQTMQNSLADMDEIYRVKLLTDWKDRRTNPTAVNIIISIFYDGAQIYKSKVTNFSPRE